MYEVYVDGQFFCETDACWGDDTGLGFVAKDQSVVDHLPKQVMVMSYRGWLVCVVESMEINGANHVFRGKVRRVR